MPDQPITTSAPLPMRSRLERATAGPPESAIHAAHASLRATEAYVRVLIDRIELARTSDLVRLDRVPADALVRLTAVSDALQDGADGVLRHLDAGLAQRMRTVADLAQQAAPADTP
jgi:hypothetical protein